MPRADPEGDDQIKRIKQSISKCSDNLLLCKRNMVKSGKRHSNHLEGEFPSLLYIWSKDSGDRPSHITIQSTEDNPDHCPCRTGCVDCYGKVHCGCPDCYTPPEPIKIRLQFGELEFERIGDIHKCEPLDPIPIHRRPVHSHHKDELETAKIKEENIFDDLTLNDKIIEEDDRYRKIISIAPVFTKVKRNEIIEKPKKEFTVRNVRPAKQTRYYCKKCTIDVCNLCFTKSCTGHAVQFLGQSKFICESPYHQY